MEKCLVVSMLMISVSCSHHHNQSKHNHHKKLSSIPVTGHRQEAYQIEHGGEKYYFDSEKELNKFKETLKEEDRMSRCVRKAQQLVCPEN